MRVMLAACRQWLRRRQASLVTERNAEFMRRFLTLVDSRVQL